MTGDRHLDWDGCFNVRDLGGVPTEDGRATRRGAVVRADSLDRLTEDGWRALYAYGIRTVVDLRNPEERGPDRGRRPDGVTTVHVPIDDTADTALWTHLWDEGLDGTPLYYRPFLDRKPERCAAAADAVARARPGGVAVHCGLGRDRTGLVALLLLALAGATAEGIAEDCDLSGERVPYVFAALGRPDDAADVRAALARRGATVRSAVLDALAGLDVEARLRAAGLSGEGVAALRKRLAPPSDAPPC
ncbi:tyrosine-protein phosphatase [Streptomyces sp. NPDC015131]|uniref:tyrosine-protein phosphatase n=1 Tax=Streptomyces sp. NPDC015131 TaxID=3364941 RepID=UPI0036FE2D40